MAAEFHMDVEGCRRCGGKHENLRFSQFTRLSVVGSVRLTHWAICPATKEPLLWGPGSSNKVSQAADPRAAHAEGLRDQ